MLQQMIFLLQFFFNFLLNLYYFIHYYFISIQSVQFFFPTNFKKNASLLDYLEEDDSSLPHENEFLSKPIEMESNISSILNNTSKKS
jgi:hypothetical protein